MKQTLSDFLEAQDKYLRDSGWTPIPHRMEAGDYLRWAKPGTGEHYTQPAAVSHQQYLDGYLPTPNGRGLVPKGSQKVEKVAP